MAMTTHKSQGRTLPAVILDLESCKGSQQPYVMLSRATSLDSILILRPFDIRKIKCNQSEELRNEMNRLDNLQLTVSEYNTITNNSHKRGFEEVEVDDGNGQNQTRGKRRRRHVYGQNN